MRVVIIGAGVVGSTIAASLAGGHDVVVLDVDPARVEELNFELDVLARAGDGTTLEALTEADVGSADMVLACTDNDETNIVACGTVKTLSDAFTVARIRDAAYLDTWNNARNAFGVDFMVGTNVLTAQAIVQVLGVPPRATSRASPAAASRWQSSPSPRAARSPDRASRRPTGSTT